MEVIMKQKKCRTAGRRKKIIGIITSLSLILCFFLGYIYIRFTQGYSTFKPPEHEAGAAAGVPSAEDSRYYEELPVREGYTVGVDTSPSYRDGRLRLNVANIKDNTVWLLARVYRDKDLIGETGIFYPGEYVADIPCSSSLSADDKILIRILAYEPDTWHSEGVAQISAVVAGE